MVSVQHSINRVIKVKSASQVGGFGVEGTVSQFSICNFRNKNVRRPERKVPIAILNFCLSVLLLVSFSNGTQADEKPLLIEGVAKTSGPQFAWFVEGSATDAAFQRATLAIKSAIDDNGLPVLKNEIFAIYSHSSLIKNRRLDLNYMQLFKEIPGSEQIADIEIPDLKCVFIPLSGPNGQMVNLVAMNYEVSQQDMQLNCYNYAIRSALNLETIEEFRSDTDEMLNETIMEMSKVK
jgi:hypothetical protein